MSIPPTVTLYDVLRTCTIIAIPCKNLPISRVDEETIELGKKALLYIRLAYAFAAGSAALYITTKIKESDDILAIPAVVSLFAMAYCGYRLFRISSQIAHTNQLTEARQPQPAPTQHTPLVTDQKNLYIDTSSIGTVPGFDVVPLSPETNKQP